MDRIIAADWLSKASSLKDNKDIFQASATKKFIETSNKSCCGSSDYLTQENGLILN